MTREVSQNTLLFGLILLFPRGLLVELQGVKGTALGVFGFACKIFVKLSRCASAYK